MSEVKTAEMEERSGIGGSEKNRIENLSNRIKRRRKQERTRSTTPYGKQTRARTQYLSDKQAVTQQASKKTGRTELLKKLIF